MIRINLIPYREAFRKQQIVEYIIAFSATIIVAISIVVVVDISVTEELTSLQKERATLEVQNKILSKTIGELRNLDSLRDEVEGKLQIVDELQAGRFRSLEILDAIATTMPRNIWLLSYFDSDGKLTVEGYGESSQAIANFMRALDRHENFDDIQLLVDKSDAIEGVNVRSFSLSFRRLSLMEKEAKSKREGVAP